jgi:hypothetical protein
VILQRASEYDWMLEHSAARGLRARQRMAEVDGRGATASAARRLSGRHPTELRARDVRHASVGGSGHDDGEGAGAGSSGCTVLRCGWLQLEPHHLAQPCSTAAAVAAGWRPCWVALVQEPQTHAHDTAAMVWQLLHFTFSTRSY